MVAKGVHSPDRIIYGKRNPGQRMVMPRMEGTEHPGKVRGCQPPVILVIQKNRFVIPTDEAVVEYRPEAEEDGKYNKKAQAAGNRTWNFFYTFGH